MSSVMDHSPDRSLATRESLLRRLTDCEDQASWQEFYQTYRDLIWRFALKAGCTVTEAQDVVQETVIAVARKLPDFKYDPAVCAFKTWLLNLTMWRIKDQFRKRAPAGRGSVAARPAAPKSDDTTRTGTVERIAMCCANGRHGKWRGPWESVWVEFIWPSTASHR